MIGVRDQASGDADLDNLEVVMLSAADAVGWEYRGTAKRAGGYVCRLAQSFTGDEAGVVPAFDAAIEGLMDVAIGAGAWHIDVLTRDLHRSDSSDAWEGTVSFGVVASG
jgi:hypothetical protein